MISGRAFNQAIVLPILGTSLLCAADFSTYRGFEFGAGLAVTAKQAGADSSAARLVHRAPALIQELDWRPRAPYRPASETADPVREGLLRFYNGELFQILATYDRQRVEGMTEADMVEALSLAYGTATTPEAEIPYHSNYAEAARVLARWENTDYSYSLVRTGDQSSFALVMSLKRLDALAQSAIVEAIRMDALAAPQRAIDLQHKKAEETRIKLDQARAANLPNFVP